MAARHSAFERLNVDRRELGRADTVRYNVLVFVVEENYDRAVYELKHFLDAPSEYPTFRKRTERFINHAVDLVNAIKAKRRFPGVHSLTMAKQQEIVDRFHDHFAELQATLKRIERIEQELKLEDVRSTILVVRTFVNAAFAIAVLAFILEGARGLLTNAMLVTDDTVMSITDYIFSKLHI